MKEHFINSETVEQKRVMVFDWIKDISEKQEVREIPSTVLKEVLESYGANFENLNEENKDNLSKYAEKKRVKGLEAVWGERFDSYKNWVGVYIEDYESRTGRELPKMKNVPDLKNEDRKASERKDLGMLSFLGDITAYAAGSLDFDNLKLLLQTRAENGAIRELPKEEREGKTKRILWDRELEPGKEPLTKDPRYDKETGELIPIDKQSIRPASFPPEFPVMALKWLSN